MEDDSSKYALQPILSVAEICAQRGVQRAVISPGSRSAPLTLAFTRHPHIRSYLVPDERAAAFIALGMAQASGQATALICTSGSAAYNYAPAIAEAYFEHVPLLVLTADRPPEWIDQRDGQTIRQQNIYGQHSKGSWALPVSYEHPDARWHIQQLTNTAITTATDAPAGPVHLNVPFREPFYPEENQQFWSEQAPRVVQLTSGTRQLDPLVWSDLRRTWSRSPLKLIVAGQGVRETIPFPPHIPVLADVISNQYGHPQSVHHQDLLLKRVLHPARFQPDLLLTFGRSIISKSVKQFLRKYRPEHHWHIQECGQVADTFQSLTRVLRTSPQAFFAALQEKGFEPPEAAYQYLWQHTDECVRDNLKHFFEDEKASFSEFEAIYRLMQQLPEDSVLHLANSMPVRYANFINLARRPDISTFANRGTSGIDGSTSTAVGHALMQEGRLHVLLTGDMAFFYDRNALWHEHMPPNLRIVLLNNQGGGIFRMIPGPTEQPELSPFFTTPHTLSAKRTAKDFGLDYRQANGRKTLQKALADFWEPGDRPQLLEIGTEQEQNTKVLNQFRQIIAEILQQR